MKRALYVTYLLTRYCTAGVLIYKILLINDINATVAQDPLEIWLGTALVLLLADPRLVEKVRDPKA